MSRFHSILTAVLAAPWRFWRFAGSAHAANPDGDRL